MKITDRVEYAEYARNRVTGEVVSSGSVPDGPEWEAADSHRATAPTGDAGYLETLQASTTACADILGLARVHRLLTAAVDQAWEAQRDVDPRTRARRSLNWPTISHPDTVGGTDIDRREADRKFWPVGTSVRCDLLPLLVAERGVVVRAWAVRDWVKDDTTGLFSAELGEALTMDELMVAGCPVQFGDRIPVVPRRPYWPLQEDVDGTCYLGGSELVL